MIGEVFARIGATAVPGSEIGLDDGDGSFALWLSRDPVSAELWGRLRAAHPVTGWWPLLLAPEEKRPREFRPWSSGELSRDSASDPDSIEVEALLAGWWAANAGLLAAIGHADAGTVWAGLAARTEQGDADAAADRLAADLLAAEPERLLGLVRAASGSEALAVAGWQGTASRTGDIGEIAAVVRSWEPRFGARVVGVGADTLQLAVGAPPPTADSRLALEHLAFCFENLLQSEADVATYAGTLTGAARWDFWWDD